MVQVNQVVEFACPNVACFPFIEFGSELHQFARQFAFMCLTPQLAEFLLGVLGIIDHGIT